MEIGSIFEVDKKQIEYIKAEDIAIETIVNRLQYTYQDSCLVSSGRDAIELALQQITNRRKCLLPMYTCDTVDMPFVRKGYEVAYYPVGKDMRPNRAKFIEYIDQFQPEVILVHGYYGQDTLSEIRKDIEVFQKQGGIVIEDVTQTLFLPAHITADYCVCSLRKWFGIPDGGFLLSKTRIKNKPQTKRNDFVQEKWQALTLKWDYLRRIKQEDADLSEMKQYFLAKNIRAEELLDEDAKVYQISDYASRILHTVHFAENERRRSENARVLYEGVHPLCRKGEIELPLIYDGNTAPLYVPIYIPNREAFQKFMRERDIYLPVLWPISQYITQMCEDTLYIYENMLAIPCDYRYTTADMQLIIEAVQDYIAEGGCKI